MLFLALCFGEVTILRSLEGIFLLYTYIKIEEQF